MKKKMPFLLFAMTLFSCSSSTTGLSPIAVGSLPTWNQEEVANFMLNYKKASFEESSFTGISNDLLYESQKITPPTLLSKPAVDPLRSGYDFKGWFKDAEGTSAWDFATEKATTSVFLYASWSASGEESYVEPVYTPVEKIDDTLTKNLTLDGVLNVAPAYGTSYLTSGGLLRLANAPDDVRFALNTTKKTGTLIESAVYEASSGTISVTSKNGNNEETDTIQVAQINGNLALNNTTYEAMAKKYEEAGAAYENYHVMLAGSSSIEFWDSYSEDLKPIVAYNHGIGGTMISDWSTSLMDRLVVPYCPKALVLYVGVNDLVNGGKDKDSIVSSAEKLLEDTHAKLPNTHLFYILINKLPGYYLGYQSTIEAIDAAMENYGTGKESWLTLIDAGKPLLKVTGVADAAYFRLDNLHLSEYGYVLWAAEIKKALKAWLG
jgi:uncharacterized repeat protein (TIGR02543 family)